MKLKIRIIIFLRSLFKEKRYCLICGQRMQYFNYGGSKAYLCNNCGY